MADTTPRRLTREQLAEIFGNNPRAIKLFENLTTAVVDTLPESIDQVQLSTLFSLHGADGSKGASAHATALATEMQSLTQAAARPPFDPTALRAEVEMLRTELHDALARLSSAVAKAQSTANEALNLTIGV